MKNALSRRMLECLLIVASLAGSANIQALETYPVRPIRMVIPFAAGGGADVVGRLIASRLSERMGQNVVADNRTGAGGVIGTEIVARIVPDGHTLGFVPASF